jgi:tetratricopeptide (TPR) repeat protein
MSDTPRIEELKRRVQVDPASIAFAALAEEYRRAGRFDEAIATCQAGLQRHPAYLSAHVTLGRALLELGRFDEAREELAHVLRAAPENLAAIRGLAEIHHRRGELPEALEQYRSALQVAKHDAELEQRVDQIARQVVPVEAAAAVPLTPEPAPTAPMLSDPAAGDPVAVVSARDVAAAPEPAQRPHLELVMRHPRAPESEAEPELRLADSQPDPQVTEPEPEFHTSALDSMQPAEADPAPFAVAAAEQEAEQETVQWVPPAQPVFERSDRTLSALESFLTSIVREKDALAARSADRR